jgi:hypothetical protein
MRKFQIISLIVFMTLMCFSEAAMARIGGGPI